MPSTEATCPTCKEPVASRDQAGFPFCSERCRLIDLGRWLDGDYRVPAHDDAPRVDDDDA